MIIGDIPKITARIIIRDIVYVAGLNALIAVILTLVVKGEQGFWHYLLVSNCIGYSICTTVTTLVYLIKPKRHFVQALLLLLAVVVGAVIGSLLSIIIEGETILLKDFTNIPLAMIVIGIIFGLLITYFFIVYENYIQARLDGKEEKLKRLSMEKENINANLKMLQAQIEPHFLFNTLSNVLNLMDTDVDKGKEMLENLTQYLRTSLVQTRNKTNTLSREVPLIKSYLDINKIRMGSRLNYIIDVPEDLMDLSIPPMLIQPIVENAIKHGLEPKVEGGEILLKVKKEDNKLKIEVTDTGVGIDSDYLPGVGSSNISQRLKALYDDEAQLIIEDNKPCGLKVLIEIPYE